MTMYNPLHPGEFIKETYIEPFGSIQNILAKELKVARSTFSRLLRGESSVSPEMALRLSKVLGRTAQSWLAMQAAYDLFHAEKNDDWKKLHPFFQLQLNCRKELK